MKNDNKLLNIVIFDIKLKTGQMGKGEINYILAPILLLFGSAFMAYLILKQNSIAIVFSILLLLLLLFNIVVKNRFSFKPYFISRWNIFSSKYSKEFEFDIPKDLAFDKILEVITESPYSLNYASKTDFEIFATTKFSWRSWGENIYIHLADSDDQTIVRFDSVAFMQVYTWGKNENNFDEFFQKLDESLTV